MSKKGSNPPPPDINFKPSPPPNTPVPGNSKSRLNCDRVKVNNLFWKDKTIHLDGYDFINCVFQNCRLVSSTRNYLLQSCSLDRNVVIEHLEYWTGDTEITKRATVCLDCGDQRVAIVRSDKGRYARCYKCGKYRGFDKE